MALSMLLAAAAAALVFAASVIRAPIAKRIAVGVASIGFALAAIEAIGQLWTRFEPNATHYVEDRSLHHEYSKELGYRPRPSRQVVSTKLLRDGTLVYEATYTYDEHRLRIVPRHSDVEPAESIFFFGCSVTFGEGVNDDETYPYRFAEATDFEYNVVNFGFSGWGPHQMLRMLELGLPDASVVGRVRQAFYLMPAYHLDRSAGEAPWDHWGPRYALEASDSGGPRAVHRGSFGDPNDPLRTMIRESFLWKIARPLWERDVDEKRALAVAIVAEAHRILRERYGVDLFVILRGASSKVEPIARALDARGIRNALGREWVPTSHDREAYRIPGDGHPTPRWHREMGRAIAERLDTIAGP